MEILIDQRSALASLDRTTQKRGNVVGKSDRLLTAAAIVIAFRPLALRARHGMLMRIGRLLVVFLRACGLLTTMRALLVTPMWLTLRTALTFVAFAALLATLAARTLGARCLWNGRLNVANVRRRWLRVQPRGLGCDERSALAPLRTRSATEARPFATASFAANLHRRSGIVDRMAR